MLKKNLSRKWIAGLAIAIVFFVLLIICIIYFFIRGEYVSTVVVQTPYYTGQGNVYKSDEEEVYIVTAAHILEGLHEYDACNVLISGEYEMQAEVRYLSETADVAFLVINLKPNGKPDAERIHFLEIKKNRTHFDNLKEGSPIYAYSCDGTSNTKINGNLTSPWIYLEDFDIEMMLAMLPTRQGMSGCGIYDEEGFFVGILCGSNEEEAAILPFSIIESEWIMVKD